MKTRVRRQKKSKIALFFILVLVYAGWCLFKPLPDLQPQKTSTTITAKAPTSALNWPASQAAVAVLNTDIFETNGTQKPVPTASTAKIITALVVLAKKPLQLNQPGSIITLSDRDVAIYKDYVTRDGSVVPVLTGEQISQYQALQTVMLPSANNMADSLAIWAYGSLQEYGVAANAYLKAHDIHNTNVGSDASGLAANSTTTANDMTKLGILAMQNPVLAQIVGQSTATGIPVAGTIKNVNDLIGINGIVGIKTGNSDEAGGAYVAASTTKIQGKNQTIVTAVVESTSLFTAMKQSLPLIKSAQSNFSQVKLVNKDQVVGKYSLPWGGSVEVITKDHLIAIAWNDTTIKAVATLDDIPASSQQGSSAGKITLKKSQLNDRETVNVVLKSTPAKPSTWWRLSHPF